MSLDYGYTFRWKQCRRRFIYERLPHRRSSITVGSVEARRRPARGDSPWFRWIRRRCGNVWRRVVWHLLTWGE